MSNVSLLRGELRFVTRKTGKTMILPIAARLRLGFSNPCQPRIRTPRSIHAHMPL